MDISLKEPKKQGSLPIIRRKSNFRTKHLNASASKDSLASSINLNSALQPSMNSKPLMKRIRELKAPRSSVDTSKLALKKSPSKSYRFDDETNLSNTSILRTTSKQHFLSKTLHKVKKHKEPPIFIKEELQEFPEVYYTGNRVFNKNQKFDNDHHFYRLVRGDHLGYRYEIIKILGKGSFGQVCEAWDHKEKALVAVKILRNKPSVNSLSGTEIELLHSLKGSRRTVEILSSFVFRGHVCIVFELLSRNLFDLLKLNKFKGLSLKVIRTMAKQILEGLKDFYDLKIIHCDLKPENILLQNEKKVAIKIIDLGSACFEDQKLFTYLQSRFYRAPEILLGTMYSTSIDMWSFGCILFELAMGEPLFTGKDELEQLSKIIEVIGAPPQNMLLEGIRAGIFFEGDKLKKKKTGKKKGSALRPLKEMVPEPLLCDLIEKCLTWDSWERLNPETALKHKFFTKKVKKRN